MDSMATINRRTVGIGTAISYDDTVVTPEILEKNGFTNEHDTNFHLAEEVSVNETWAVNIVMFGRKHDIVPYYNVKAHHAIGGKGISIEISYHDNKFTVVDLKNVLRICKIDKIILC